MATRGSSGGRLSAAFGAGPGPTEPMPPDGAWPSVLREVVAGSDPPTVPLPLAGPVPGAGAPGAPRPTRYAAVHRDDAPTPAGAEGVGGDVPTGHGRLERLVRAVVPVSWRGARVDTGRPGASALALVAALAALLAAVGVWWDRPQTEPVGAPGALPAVVVTEAPAADAPAPEATQPPAGPLVLSVSGKVARPGLIELPDGSRVADALEAAGGALPGTDLSALNLARRVVDGEQIAVGVPPAPDAAAAPAAGAAEEPGAGPSAGPVDLNTATEAQLDALPGVGPVTAQRILEWRRRNGRFARVEQLREIEGIGERRFAQLRELVVV
ncbi:helix-hairpin-helix domain-containing protein [Pseudonocardia saturnea]